MKKFYFIVPVILLAVFAYFFVDYTKQAEIKKEAAAAKKIADEAAEQARKEEAQKIAAADAKKRMDERLAREKEEEERKRIDAEAIDKQIADDFKKFSDEIAALNAEITKIDTAIIAARTEREQVTAENLAFAKEVELLRIQRRTIDLDTQRLLERIAQKAANITLGNPLLSTTNAP